jgi:hypothetical protein
VSWGRGDGSGNNTFVVSSVVVAEDLQKALDSHAVDGVPTTESGAGILIWHTGLYRASPVYLSFAAEADALYPSRYRHFTGWDGASTTWSTDEADAIPVIWDDVGELSALALAGTGYENNLDNYIVIYNINSSGQEGIVMRMAERPQGPYSAPVILHDCSSNTGLRTDLIAQINQGKLGNTAVGCYGGFTHPALWGKQTNEAPVPAQTTRMRFNISLWQPYRVGLMQTDITKNE